MESFCNLLRESIHEENTKEIMSVKESVCVIQISLDLYKL